MKRVCVFCGSSKGHQGFYSEVARALGQELVKRGVGLVYGGGNVGLMGVVAEVVLAGGGEVIGVIPQFLVEKELALFESTTLHIVGSMHERKALMADLTDAFVALPGGFGTLEEICEMVTWRQLALHRKPCVLLNVNGFFDALLAFFNHQVREGFVTHQNRMLIQEAKDPVDLVNQVLRDTA